MKNRKDFQTRFKKDGDRSKGKPRALRFPAEIEDSLSQIDDWKAFVVEAVRYKLLSQDDWGLDGDHEIASEMFTRPPLSAPGVVKSFPHDGHLSLESKGLIFEMVLSEHPWFQVKGASEFRLQWVEDDWIVDGSEAIAWSDLEKAQEFCENMMHIWEQVMISLDFADRID